MKHLEPTPEQAALLEAYSDLVRRWAPRLDLVSDPDLDRFEDRHIGDSLRLGAVLVGELEGMPPVRGAIDVGSGAGLPGIPLAIVLPRWGWRLLEPRRLRAAFLDEVVRELDLACEVIATTAVAAAADPRLGEGHDVATARALAPPTTAFALIRPLVRHGGIAAVLTGNAIELPSEAAFVAPGVATMHVGHREQGKSG